MNKHARFFRMCILQLKEGRRIQRAMEQPVPDTIRLPFVDKYVRDQYGQTRPLFGSVLYRWNGRDLTVQGWPVYR